MATGRTTLIEAADYFATPGLSNSGMGDLAVSPLRYWHLHVNPHRLVQQPTPEMQFGSALHCAVLEPQEFDRRYVCQVGAEDFRDCLVTIEDLRAFLKDKGVTPKGTRKADVIAQVQGLDPSVPILEVELQKHETAHSGKISFKKEEWFRLGGATRALLEEPHVQRLLEKGDAEVSLFAKDKEKGVPLKARLDWVGDGYTLDLKTFTQKRGKSIEASVADAIFYECYYRQAYFYSTLRELNGHKPGDFVLAFVESDEPHEVRIRSLLPKRGGQPNLYWTRALIEVRGFIATYAEYMAHFGEKPWRYAQNIVPLADEEIKALAW